MFCFLLRTETTDDLVNGEGLFSLNLVKTFREGRKRTVAYAVGDDVFAADEDVDEIEVEDEDEDA